MSVLENFGLLSMIIMFLLIGVGLNEGIRSSVLAMAVDFTGDREGTTLGLAFTLMDGIGGFGALLGGLGRRNPVKSCVSASRDTLYFFADFLFLRFFRSANVAPTV